MDAKTLSDYLKKSSNPEIVELSVFLEKGRVGALEQLRIELDPESPLHWSKQHKLTVAIHTDWDFYIKDGDQSIDADVYKEWVGDSLENVISLAKEFLTDQNNYTGVEKTTKSFIENYVNEALCTISSGVSDKWSSCGNWEVDFSYERPSSEPPKAEDFQLNFNLFGREMCLLTKDELSSFGLE